MAFWRAATGWRWREGNGDEFAGKLFPPAGSSAQLLFQKLGSDDPATAVRAHIDLGADDLEAEAGRLVGLGADRLGPGRGWIVLRDPVGMIFCVTGNAARQIPDPVVTCRLSSERAGNPGPVYGVRGLNWRR